MIIKYNINLYYMNKKKIYSFIFILIYNTPKYLKSYKSRYKFYTVFNLYLKLNPNHKAMTLFLVYFLIYLLNI